MIDANEAIKRIYSIIKMWNVITQRNVIFDNIYIRVYSYGFPLDIPALQLIHFTSTQVSLADSLKYST